MRKTFPLTDPRHKPPQVINGIKDDVRKYLKRERGKKLPEGTDYWDFDCKVGQHGATVVTHVGDLVKAIDDAAAKGWAAVHIEILSKAKSRGRKANADD